MPRGITSGSCTARTARGPASPTSASRPSGRSSYYDPAYNQVKVFTITDRPVYRPGQPVQFKFWVAHAQYDQPDASDFAGKTVHRRDPQSQGREGLHQELHGRRLRRLRRLVRAALRRGAGRLPGPHPEHGRRLVPRRGVQEARVRGDRRGPDEAGDARREDRRPRSRRSTTSARRSPRPRSSTRSPAPRPTSGGIPSARWDWLFGPGYWWFAADYTWYPGWSRVGLLRPVAVVVGPPAGAARGRRRGRGADPARRHGRRRDRHRPGQGDSIPTRTTATRSRPRSPTSRAARSSARAPCWSPASRSRSTPGSIAATTAPATRSRPAITRPDARPQAGRRQGDAHAAEDHLRRRAQAGRDARARPGTLALDADGQARQPIKAAAPGPVPALGHDRRRPGPHDRGRLPVHDHRARASTGRAFRFNDLELIPDRKEYQPGETVKLLINTNQADSTVLLFVRPTNGVYLPPKVVRLARQEHGRGDRRSSRATCPTSSSRR